MTTWPAPAKINLFLHITGQRADGYHNLQTVFQLLDLCDFLHFEVLDEKHICLQNPLPGVDAEDDLIVRAARCLQQHSGHQQGVAVRVDKHIPMQGGLGGGSSDAATTLVALNYLWQLELSAETLAQLGVALGADVPVFVHGQSAFAEGVGEHLTPVNIDPQDYLIIKPDCAVSTAEIFAAEDLTRHTPPITIRDFLAGEGHNDCLSAVCRRYPQVQRAIEWLDGFSPARLTGTGACIFAKFDSRDEAERVRDQLPPEWQGFVASGLNQSPLIERLQQSD